MNVIRKAKIFNFRMREIGWAIIQRRKNRIRWGHKRIRDIRDTIAYQDMNFNSPNQFKEVSSGYSCDCDKRY